MVSRDTRQLIPSDMVLNAISRAPGFLRSRAIRAYRRKLGPAMALDPMHFIGRRVLILGPARTVEEDLADIDPSAFDLMVKMNNGLDTPIPCLGGDALRCDLLFHCMTNDARRVTPQALMVAGTQTVVHRTATNGAFLETMKATRLLSPSVAVKHIPPEVYKDVAQHLGGAVPTTGLMAARFFLDAPVAALGIVGFTFFQTAYLPRYDDQVHCDESSVRRIAARNHHAPSLEAALLHDAVKTARNMGKTLILGRNVTSALDMAVRNV